MLPDWTHDNNGCCFIMYQLTQWRPPWSHTEILNSNLQSGKLMTGTNHLALYKLMVKHFAHQSQTMYMYRIIKPRILDNTDIVSKQTEIRQAYRTSSFHYHDWMNSSRYSTFNLKLCVVATPSNRPHTCSTCTDPMWNALCAWRRILSTS